VNNFIKREPREGYNWYWPNKTTCLYKNYSTTIPISFSSFYFNKPHTLFSHVQHHNHHHPPSFFLKSNMQGQICVCWTTSFIEMVRFNLNSSCLSLISFSFSTLIQHWYWLFCMCFKPLWKPWRVVKKQSGNRALSKTVINLSSQLQSNWFLLV
jgi:hypothetical protein